MGDKAAASLVDSVGDDGATVVNENNGIAVDKKKLEEDGAIAGDLDGVILADPADEDNAIDEDEDEDDAILVDPADADGDIAADKKKKERAEKDKAKAKKKAEKE